MPKRGSGKTDKRHAKAQSAMEYLMTYGWAILVIAVVLAVLYQLGIFSSLTQGPRASPGNCEVARPYGPDTSSDVSLEGICNGELPRVVMSFSGAQTSNVIIANVNPTIGNQITIALWIYSLNSNNGEPFAGGGQGGDFKFTLGGNQAECTMYASGTWFPSSPVVSIPTNQWTFWACTATAGGTGSMYVNGKLVGTGAAGSTLPVSGPYQIGTYVTPFSGYMADVQIYNTTLNAAEIQALYLEGIGGAPISPTYVVAWWPLNGNAQDYSGNNNNGQAGGVSYPFTWSNNYQAP